jgi:ribosomal protein S18 acetylase RimI-like enzyme
MGSTGRRRVAERFDEEQVVQRLIGEYHRLLTRKGLLGTWQGPFLLRRARSADIESLARLHEEIPHGFLPSLGAGFLRRLYRALVQDPAAVVVVAANGKEDVVGFAAGVESVSDFYRRFLLRHGVQAGLAALGQMVRRGTVERILETARYPKTSEKFPEAELLSIAVSRQRRGQGAGRALVETLIDSLASRNVRAIKVTVGADNREANEFYKNLGFRRIAEISVHQGIASNIWMVDSLKEKSD